MLYPQLSESNISKELQMEFKGYNHNLYVSENQYYDMQNMTSSFYPILSPRGPRGNVEVFLKPNGLIAKDKLAWVDGTNFFYGGVLVGTVTDTEKQFIGMGAYILIFPDKKYYNTKTNEFGNLENEKVTSGTVSYALSKQDGSAYSGQVSSPTPPSSPTNGQLWIDTTQTPNVLKQYSTTSQTWVSVPTTYVKISLAGIGVGFKKGDGVTISGSTVTSLNADMVLQDVGNDYLVVIGLLNASTTQTAALTIKRVVPDMEFLTESENRIWGCNSEKHEIYSCKLGDPFNWKVFNGISTDSYAVTVGTDGKFTGAITHLGYVLFFKENAIHKIMGNKPANYQITNSNVRGVEEGSHKSIVVVNETLFYKSKTDVCAYDGGIPSSISADLGTEYFSDAVAGALGNKYYISMKDADGDYHLYVYDSKINTWHKEDDAKVSHFARYKNELYFIDATTKTLSTVNGRLSIDGSKSPYIPFSALEKDVEWFVETGNIGINQPDNKYISKLQVRVTIEQGSKFQIDLQYDSDKVWHKVHVMSAAKLRSYLVPIMPRRCDHLKIRFSGMGESKVYSITKSVEVGGE